MKSHTYSTHLSSSNLCSSLPFLFFADVQVKFALFCNGILISPTAFFTNLTMLLLLNTNESKLLELEVQPSCTGDIIICSQMLRRAANSTDNKLSQQKNT